MAPHSSTPAWKIPWMEKPGRLQSMGSLRVGHDLSDFTFTFHFHALEKEMATQSCVLAWRIPGGNVFQFKASPSSDEWYQQDWWGREQWCQSLRVPHHGGSKRVATFWPKAGRTLLVRQCDLRGLTSHLIQGHQPASWTPAAHCTPAQTLVPISALPSSVPLLWLPRSLPLSDFHSDPSLIKDCCSCSFSSFLASYAKFQAFWLSFPHPSPCHPSLHSCLADSPTAAGETVVCYG